MNWSNAWKELSATPNETYDDKRIAASRQAFLQTLGLAYRARAASAGSDAAMELVRKRRAGLVVLASDVGGNADKKFRDKCAFYHTPLVQVATRDELGRACGRGQSVVIAVTDPGFAAKLAGLAGEIFGGEVV